MSAVSDVSICNIALTQLGAARINAIDEDSKNARACLSLFDITRDAVLEDHPWTFAQKRLTLALLAEVPDFTSDGVSLMYQKPVDMLKLNFTNSESALVKIEGTKILSDTAGLKVKYTYRNDNPQTYFAKFIIALAARLAADLAYGITSSRTLAVDMNELYYKVKLPDAISADSQQGTPLSPAQDEWLLGRISGSASSIVGRSGWATWYPVNFF